MATYPSLPLWTDAYLSDTHPGLTLEEHGCYLLLMMLAWRQPTCSLPDDDQWMARRLGVHGNRFRKLKASVLERFWTLGEDGWTQKRLKKEAGFLREKSEKNRSAANKRWSETSSVASEINDVGTTDGMQAQCERSAPTPTPTPTPTPIKQPNNNAASRSSSWRWEGKIIRLSPDDYEAWETSYSQLDLPAELQALDDYYDSKLEGDQRKDWFNRTSTTLANKNRVANTARLAALESQEPAYDPNSI